MSDAGRERAEYALAAEWNFNLVGGDRRSADETIPVVDPSTGETIASVPRGGAEDVDDAYAAAVDAQRKWATTTPQHRSRAIRQVLRSLEERRAEIAGLLAAESGSTSLKSQIEINASIGATQEAATMPTRLAGEHRPSMLPGKENTVKRVPAGVIGVITAWNYPLYLGFRAVAPAVALGNAVVLKPASQTPITGGLVLAKLFEEADVPSGLVNVVTGPGATVGDAVTKDPDASVVAFTGSTSVGRTVAGSAASNLALPAMELGGNAPHVVLEDSDVDRAVAAGTFGSFLHQGQACNSINRHLVHESIYDEYVRALADRASALPTGSAHDRETIVGPLIDESQRDAVLDFVDRTIEAGATLETGGGHDGLVVHPTVLSNVTNDMPAACNEHFGPIAPVIPFETDEEAIRIANDTEYGLSASVFSGDRGRAMDVADAIDSGMVHVNDHAMNEEPHLPYGGTKASGIGRYNGDEIIREFTEPKWLSVRREPTDYPF